MWIVLQLTDEQLKEAVFCSGRRLEAVQRWTEKYYRLNRGSLS